MSRLKEFNVSIGNYVLDGRHLLAIVLAILTVGLCCTFAIKTALDGQVTPFTPYQDKVKSLDSFSGYSKVENGSKGGLYVEGKGIIEQGSNSTKGQESMGYNNASGSSGGMGSINMVEISSSGKNFDWNGGSNYANATE